MATYETAPDATTPTTASRKRPLEGDADGPEKAAKKEKTVEKSADADALPQVDTPSNGAAAGVPDEDFLCRVLAESRHCGGLIGRQGQTINDIRTGSGATVEIKSPVPYATKRIMRLKGPLSKVIAAVHLVLAQLANTIVDSKNRKAERTKSAAVQLAGAPDELDTPSDPNTMQFEFTMLIPGPQIGAVIGKGGCNISDTRSKSGTSIAVAQEYLPNSSEKTVAITGSHKSIGIAAERIIRQVATCAEKGEAEYPYEPQPEGDAAAAAALFAPGPGYGGNPRGAGRGGGRGGRGGGYNQHRAGPYGAPYGNQGAGWQQGAGGPPSSRWGASADGGGAYGAPGAAHNAPGADVGPQVVVPFPVSKSLVGAVIGRGGQNISAIRARSGAQIRIEDAVDGTDERMITITGTGHAVKAAVSMIQYHLQHQ